MNLQDKLVSLSDYNIGFRTYENNFIITIVYKDDWAIIEPSDKDVKFFKDENKQNTYYYITQIGGKKDGLQNIFNTIDETIMYNKELEEKVELLKEKINQLYDLFNAKSIDELKTLEFVTKKGKSNRQRKKPKEETKETVASTVVKEEANETASVETLDDKIMKSINKVSNKQKKEKTA